MLGTAAGLAVYGSGYLRTGPSAMSVSASNAAPTPGVDTPPAPSQWKDGSYSGWGTSQHGDIQVSVEIRGGRIAATSIAQCLTRYSCSWIAGLPPQVVAGQNVRVDLVSGATQSSEAFRAAVADALRQAG
jgi:uncharacterized protein with FMN-binding domain